jgi:RNA polymerase-binding transcription factor DksA
MNTRAEWINGARDAGHLTQRQAEQLLTQGYPRCIRCGKPTPATDLKYRPICGPCFVEQRQGREG